MAMDLVAYYAKCFCRIERPLTATVAPDAVMPSLTMTMAMLRIGKTQETYAKLAICEKFAVLIPSSTLLRFVCL